MICRIDSSSPPGVSMVIRTRLACSLLACAIPFVMYSASTGSISPEIRSSTTFEEEAESAAVANFDEAACEVRDAKIAADSPASASATVLTRRQNNRRDWKVFTEKHYSAGSIT